MQGKSPKKHGDGIYHPKELYSPKQGQEHDEFRRADPYNGSKYYNVLSTLNLGRKSSVGEVIQRSKDASYSLKATLRQQQDPHFLKTQLLPRVPVSRGAPVVAKAHIDKNVAKRAGNDAHSKITNGGYCRTTYGGFFMH